MPSNASSAKSSAASTTSVTDADAGASKLNTAAAAKAMRAASTTMTDAVADDLLAALATAAKGVPGATAAKNSVVFLNSLISQIDRELTTQLNEVIHDEHFLTLEGTWRGLEKLLKDTDVNKTLWVEVADISKSELHADLKQAADYSVSHIWKQAYDERYNTLGGKPFGVFVSGYGIENTEKDRELVEKLSQVGAAAHAPFILSASAKLFGKKSFVDVRQTDDLKNAMTGVEYAGWNALRKNADSRFVALTLPRTLARAPHDLSGDDPQEFKYQEAPRDERSGKPKKMDHEHLCWSSSAYSYGGVLTKAFRQTNWCTAIVGKKTKNEKLNYGTVESLPLYTYYTDSDNAEIYPPTEISVPLDKHFAFAEMGLLPLAWVKDEPIAAFLGGKTLFQPQGKPGTKTYANDFAASGLQNVMPASRISHYMKMVGIDLNGKFKEASELETLLNNWLANYKAMGTPDEMIKTQQPLKEFSVSVHDTLGTGVFDVQMQLQFWTMVYSVHADVSMVAEVERKAT